MQHALRFLSYACVLLCLTIGSRRNPVDSPSQTINSSMVLYDPAHMNVLPAAALLFRRRDVREATAGYFQRVSAEPTRDPSRAPSRHSRVALLGNYGLTFDDVADAPTSMTSNCRRRRPPPAGRPTHPPPAR